MMNKTIRFKEWEKTYNRHNLPVCVIAGGTSMDQYVDSPNYFHLRYGDVIGVNWTFLNFEVDYVVACHKPVVLKHANSKPESCLVYSKKAAEFRYRLMNPVVPGIVYNRTDLMAGSSSAIMAMDFATKLTTGEVHIYGVDLAYEGDRMYYNGYFQEGGKKPAKPVFQEWAERVRGQIGVLCKERGNAFIFHNLTTNIL